MENGLEQERSVARVGRRLMERPAEKKIRPDRRHWPREGIEKETTPESVIEEISSTAVISYKRRGRGRGLGEKGSTFCFYLNLKSLQTHEWRGLVFR